MKNTGKAVIYGMGNSTILIYGYASIGNVLLTSANVTDTYDSVNLVNAEGDVIGQKVCNMANTCIIEMMPVGGSLINTVNAAYDSVQMPLPNGLVLLTYFPASINGYWNYSGGGTFRMVKDNFGILTIPLIRRQNIDSRKFATVIQTV